MKFTGAVFILLLSTTLIFPQTKYMIYFKDKGITSTTTLHKTSSQYKAAEKSLTPRAIERRKKVMGENYITYYDIPINENYLKQVEDLGIKIVHKLKWFNAVSCYLSDEQLNEVSAISSVLKIEKVNIYKSTMPVEDGKTGQKSTPTKNAPRT